MAAVTIYKDNNLEYIVLPQRKVLAKTTYGDLRNSLAVTEKSAFWQNKGLRERIKKSGDRFFKVHSKELDSLDMGSSDGSMSDGFFLYLTYYRFQNQQYTAYFINDKELNQLTKSSDIKKSDDLVKLLTLETALEPLFKMKPGETPEYGDIPPNTPTYKGKRGGTFYYPSEVGTLPADDAAEDIPIGEEVEHEVVTATDPPELTSFEPDIDEHGILVRFTVADGHFNEQRIYTKDPEDAIDIFMRRHQLTSEFEENPDRFSVKATSGDFYVYGDIPKEEREVEVGQPPEVKPESSSDVKPRKKAALRVRTVDAKQADALVKAVLKDFPNNGLDTLLDIYSTSLEDFFTRIIEVSSDDDNTFDVSNKTVFTVRVEVIDEDERRPVGDVGRRFSINDLGQLVVEHSYFMLKEEAQNKGLAADINENVEKEYEKLGVHSITLQANVDIGGYAWARQGYDFASRGDFKNIKNSFLDKIYQLSRGRRRAIPADEYDATLAAKLADLVNSGDFQAVFEELWPDQDWSALNDLGDDRLDELWELEDEGDEEKVLKWSELLEKIEAIRPSGKAPRIIGDDVVRAAEQVEKFRHAWEFASWHLNGEHLGKEFMLGSNWNAKKILDKKSEGYLVGKKYFESKRNEKNIS